MGRAVKSLRRGRISAGAIADAKVLLHARDLVSASLHPQSDANSLATFHVLRQEMLHAALIASGNTCDSQIASTLVALLHKGLPAPCVLASQPATEAIISSDTSLHAHALRIADAYEGLLSLEAKQSSTKVTTTRCSLGAVYTPKHLADALVRAAFKHARKLDRVQAGTIQLHDRLTVCDPSCGSGRFLVAALETCTTNVTGHAPMLFGADIDPCAVLVCRFVLATHPAMPLADIAWLADRVLWGNGLLGLDAESAKRAGALTREAADAHLVRFNVQTTKGVSTKGLCSNVRTRAVPVDDVKGTCEQLQSTAPIIHWHVAFAELMPNDGDGRFDVVLGNPPFLNQLSSKTSRARVDASIVLSHFPGVIRGYADAASAFLARGLALTKPRGICCMIQPMSVLASRDSGPLRRSCARTAQLVGLWAGDSHAFAASVYACAPILQRIPEAESTHKDCSLGGSQEHKRVPPRQTSRVIRLYRGADCKAARLIRATPRARWSALAADTCGVPLINIDPTFPTLGSWLDATADFRDMYYALRDVLIEVPENQTWDRETHSYTRVLTSGLVDVARSRWGVSLARIHGKAWQRPGLSLRAASASAFLAKMLPIRCVPKIIVATQTRVIEAVVDADGGWLPTTPMITVTRKASDIASELIPDLWTIAAALASPIATLVAARRTFGTAMTPTAIKLAAREIATLPRPHDIESLTQATHAFKAASLADSPTSYSDALRVFAGAAIDSYGLDAKPRSRVLAWWLARAGFAP